MSYHPLLSWIDVAALASGFFFLVGWAEAHADARRARYEAQRLEAELAALRLTAAARRRCRTQTPSPTIYDYEQER